MNPNSVKYQVIIVGGGLAGLCSAIHLSKSGIKVLLIEKNVYPKHKVCGEYISNEVLPYLEYLDFDPFEYGAKKITNLTFSTAKNQTISTELTLGGFGISRYCIDHTLAKKAAGFSTTFLHATVSDISYSEDEFQVTTNTNEKYRAQLVLGTFGKRSNLDIKMSRTFIKQSSPYLAVKAHYKGKFHENLVCLHNFAGGYCGLSKVETESVNVCYITDYKSFKKHKNIEDFQKQVMSKNRSLKQTFEDLEMEFDKPLTISQVSFATKQPVENHILMCGDSAGMIHPLAGNGMGMAIRSAQMASSLILDFLSGKIESRQELEKQYTHNWKKEFQSRLNTGHIISKLLKVNILSEILVSIIKVFPFILPMIIKMTHGKPMKV